METRAVVEGEGRRRWRLQRGFKLQLVPTESLSMVYMPTYASEHSGLGRMVEKQGNLTLMKVAY